MSDVTPYEPYRVILDYEALQDGFLDRIEDLNTTLEQIDMAGNFAKGNVQKLLNRGPTKAGSDRRDASKRTLGWESLGKMLQGTGLALVLVVDDERFAPLKEQLMTRKRVRMERAKPLSTEVLQQAISATFANHGKIGGLLRSSRLSPIQRKKLAKAAGKARWQNQSRKREGLRAES